MINGRPLALSSHTNYEIADVLTPNRLLMGRNNDRSPAFPVEVASNPDKFIKPINKFWTPGLKSG